MAWFRNHYHCDDCGADWEDEWSCCCDDDCSECGSRHWSPATSDDLTFVVKADDGVFPIYESPRTAEHTPDYQLASVATTHGAAIAYVNHRLATYWDEPKGSSPP